MAMSDEMLVEEYTPGDYKDVFMPNNFDQVVMNYVNSLCCIKKKTSNYNDIINKKI